MGKKAKFKLLRKIASQMPEINVPVGSRQIITGEQLINEGVKEVQGERVVSDKEYKRRIKIAQPLNHHRKMKQLYYQKGAAGVNSYIAAVKEFQAQHQNKNG